MPRLIIQLPADRTGFGTLRLIGNGGSTVAGPFRALGRADRKTAAAKGNPTGDPLKPYGDTPCGTFNLIDIVQTAEGTRIDVSKYGRHGAIRLRPAEGQAARAGRAGRTGLMIHGGEASPGGDLRPTNGCVRLSDDDMRLLLEAIARVTISEGPPLVCMIEETAIVRDRVTAADEGYEEADPPPGMEADWHLRGVAAAWGFQPVSPESDAGGSRALAMQGHDREAHDREVHDRSAEREPASHDREPAAHDREASSDPASHDRDPGRDHASHDREPAAHDRGF